MNRRRLLQRIQRGHVRNIAFMDLIDLVEAFGFRFVGSSGSHRRYVHPDIPPGLNFQEERGQAKGFQVSQFLKLIEQYDLRLED